MKVAQTGLEGLYEIRTQAVADDRGQFSRLFCEKELAELRKNLHFTQINLSETRRQGTIRGFHYQTPPAAEAKMIRCLRGRVFDVAVDLRRGSPSFLRWHGVELSADNELQVFIPEGFAHGFQALTDDVQLLYFHTAPWTAGSEAGLRHDDPRLAVDWPLPATLVSQRDQSYPLLGESYCGVQL